MLSHVSYPSHSYACNLSSAKLAQSSVEKEQTVAFMVNNKIYQRHHADVLSYEMFRVPDAWRHELPIPVGTARLDQEAQAPGTYSPKRHMRKKVWLLSATFTLESCR